MPDKNLILSRVAIEQFREHGTLSTHVLSSARAAASKGEEGADEVYTAVQRLEALSTEFEQRVWGAWLKRCFDETSICGGSAETGDLLLLAYALAGRVMVTLQRPGALGSHVSLLGYTGMDSAMYVRGCVGDHVEIGRLIKDANAASETLRGAFTPDNNVCLGV